MEKVDPGRHELLCPPFKGFTESFGRPGSL